MKKIMKEKNHVVPDEVLSKEFLSQFMNSSQPLLWNVSTKVLPAEVPTSAKNKSNPNCLSK